VRWLPIACVLVLILAVAYIASNRAPGPGAAAASYTQPSSPAAPVASAVANPAEPATSAIAPSAWLRSLVGVSSPVPVADPSVNAATPEPPASEAPINAVQPAIVVAATVEPASGAPVGIAANLQTSAAPPAAPAPSRLADNAPTTAREDALLRSWPYAPLSAPTQAGGVGRNEDGARALQAAPTATPAQSMTLAPGATAGDPRGAETAERAGLWAPLPSSTTNDAARKEQQDPLAGWGPPPAPALDPRRFTEAHWQGIELIPNTPLVAQALKIPADAQGVIMDDVSLPADLQGFVAGDLVTNVNGVPTPDLTSFIDATDRVRDLPQAELTILREGQLRRMQLIPLKQRLGTANGETAGMIPPGARMPHPYRGPCTNCHRIGTTGNLPIDQGDMMLTAAPVIRADDRRPHRDRGPCRACHQIRP